MIRISAAAGDELSEIPGNIPGQEIEHPMAQAILGGLVSFTLLNLFAVPSLYLRFARQPERRRPETVSIVSVR